MHEYKASINGVIIASNVKIADNFFSRLIGLLAHKKLGEGEGLLITHCRQVHTFGMRFHIDVIFLNKEGEILHIENDMGPGKTSNYIKKATKVLELEAGVVKKYNIKVGDIIIF